MMERIPLVASLDELPAAIEFGEKQPATRWYIARRAAQLGARDMIPESWISHPSSLVASALPGRESGELSLPDGSFKIGDREGVLAAVRSVHLAEDQAAAQEHIVRRAFELGVAQELPSEWIPESVVAAAAVTENELTLDEIANVLGEVLTSYVHGEYDESFVVDSFDSVALAASAIGALDEMAVRGSEQLKSLYAETRLETDEFDTFTEALAASVRHVRTPEGSKFYGQPIGSAIVPNTYLPNAAKAASDLAPGDFIPRDHTNSSSEKIRVSGVSDAGESNIGSFPTKMTKISGIDEKGEDVSFNIQSTTKFQTFKAVPKGAKATLSEPTGDVPWENDPSNPQRKWYASPKGGYTDKPAFALKDENGNPISHQDQAKARAEARAKAAEDTSSKSFNDIEAENNAARAEAEKTAIQNTGWASVDDNSIKSALALVESNHDATKSRSFDVPGLMSEAVKRGLLPGSTKAEPEATKPTTGFVKGQQKRVGVTNFEAKGSHPDRFVPRLTMADGVLPKQGMHVAYAKDPHSNYQITETYQHAAAVRHPDGRVKTISYSQLNDATNEGAPVGAPTRPGSAEASGVGGEKTTKIGDDSATVDTGGEGATPQQTTQLKQEEERARKFQEGLQASAGDAEKRMNLIKMRKRAAEARKGN